MKPRGISWRQLLTFELTTGFPIAIKCLYKHLGSIQTLRLMALFSWQDLALNDVKNIPRNAHTTQEKMSLHQFKPVFFLYRGLKYMVGQEQALQILSDVVATSGSQFLERIVPDISPEFWNQLNSQEKDNFSNDLRAKFFNSQSILVEDPNFDFAFDVQFCYFVSFARQLNCPEIVPLFCEADSRYFEDNDTGIEFQREHTLGKGDACCDFRFCFKN